MSEAAAPSLPPKTISASPRTDPDPSPNEGGPGRSTARGVPRTLPSETDGRTRSSGPIEPRLSAGLTELPLPTFRSEYEENARQAVTEAWS